MRRISVKNPKLFRGLLSHYRMVFVNESSMEEVASFRLTKGSVYGMFSTIFLGVALATVAVLVFTPLRYYIPGYGSRQNRTQVLQLKQRIDSLTDLMTAREAQWASVQNIIAGKDPVVRDTAMLSASQISAAGQMPTVLPQPEEIRQQATAASRQKGKKK